MTWWSCLLCIRTLQWSWSHPRLFDTCSSLGSKHSSRHKLVWSCTCFLNARQWRGCLHWWCWCLLSVLLFALLIKTMRKCCLETCWLIFRVLTDHPPHHCHVLSTMHGIRSQGLRFYLVDWQQASLRLGLEHHLKFWLGKHNLSLWWSQEVLSC